MDFKKLVELQAQLARMGLAKRVQVARPQTKELREEFGLYRKRKRFSAIQHSATPPCK